MLINFPPLLASRGLIRVLEPSHRGLPIWLLLVGIELPLLSSRTLLLLRPPEACAEAVQGGQGRFCQPPQRGGSAARTICQLPQRGARLARGEDATAARSAKASLDGARCWRLSCSARVSGRGR